MDDETGARQGESYKMFPAKPEWLRKRLPVGAAVQAMEGNLEQNRLHTICQEACCPNQGECFSKGVATFLIMGNVCTRNCRFCAVDSGTPLELDANEPLRLAEEVKRLGLRFVVVTSVTRDDLPDGGAEHFARVIEVMRSECPGVGIEVLIPDLQGSRPALKTVVDAAPEVLNHNVETVPRLYASVRPQADYRRSLEVLREAKALNPSLTTKSGLMVGLGETREEVLEVMVDLRSALCDVITIGQYLSPSAGHHPVVEYVHPEIFEKYRRDALRLGFRDAASSPFVRSSYMAEKYYKKPGTRGEG
jgi:lipoic acid synthetase